MVDIYKTKKKGDMAKSVDAIDLGSIGVIHESSNLSIPTRRSLT